MSHRADAESITEALRQRAVQLDNEAVSAAVTGLVTAPGREPRLLQVIASEFRAIADMSEGI